MSFFHENTSDLKKSIAYFNNLDDVKKAFIVGKVSETTEYSQDEYTKINPIIEAIEHDLITLSEITIANKIIELGMDNTYAQLFVKNIVDKRPPIEYHLNILERMDEKDFRDKLLGIVKGHFFDLLSKEDLIDKLKIESSQFNAIVSLYTEAAREYLRGEVTLNIIRQKASSQINSEKKVEAIVESVQTTYKQWWDRLVFYNTQETYLAVQEMREQNKLILEAMKEVLEILKESKS